MLENLSFQANNSCMNTIGYKYFKEYIEKCLNDALKEPILIKRKNKNIVILSEKTYNSLLETFYLTKDKTNNDWLNESKEQLKVSNKYDNFLSLGGIIKNKDLDYKNLLDEREMKR